MAFPTPEDPARAPVWENYLIAQVVQASLGQIPEHALAVGVEVAGPDALLRFVLTHLSETDAEDMDDIVSELEVLVGPDVRIEKTHVLADEHMISPFEPIRWVFKARG